MLPYVWRGPAEHLRGDDGRPVHVPERSQAPRRRRREIGEPHAYAEPASFEVSLISLLDSNKQATQQSLCAWL